MIGKLPIYSHGFDPSGGADFCYPGGYPIGKSCKRTTSAQEVRDLVLSVPKPPFHSPEGAVMMGKLSIYSHGFDPSGGAGFCYPGGYVVGKSCKWTTSAQEVRGLVLSVPIPPFHSPEGAVLIDQLSIYSHGFDPSGGERLA